MAHTASLPAFTSPHLILAGADISYRQLCVCALRLHEHSAVTQVPGRLNVMESLHVIILVLP